MIETPIIVGLICAIGIIIALRMAVSAIRLILVILFAIVLTCGSSFVHVYDIDVSNWANFVSDINTLKLEFTSVVKDTLQPADIK